MVELERILYYDFNLKLVLFNIFNINYNFEIKAQAILKNKNQLAIYKFIVLVFFSKIFNILRQLWTNIFHEIWIN